MVASAFLSVNGQNQAPAAAYFAAFCSSPGGSVGLENLEVFPDKGEAIRVSLPFGLARFAYGPDGKALYAERRNDLTTGDKHEVYRIDLNPIRVSAVPAQVSLKPIHSIAVSIREDRLLISGGYEEGGRQYCGIYQIDLPTGVVRPILQSVDCRYRSAWLDLSLAPNGEHAVAIHNQRLELIDVARRESRVLGGGFLAASWSPDGRWIAALESVTGEKTILIDAKSLTRKRVLGTSETHWSPDSRYLLAVNPRGCDEAGTIESLEVKTGARVTISSSRCRVYQPTTGWVSSSIVR